MSDSIQTEEESNLKREDVIKFMYSNINRLNKELEEYHRLLDYLHVTDTEYYEFRGAVYKNEV